MVLQMDKFREYLFINSEKCGIIVLESFKNINDIISKLVEYIDLINIKQVSQTKIILKNNSKIYIITVNQSYKLRGIKIDYLILPICVYPREFSDLLYWHCHIGTYKYITTNILDELENENITKFVRIEKCGQHCPYFEEEYNNMYNDYIKICSYSKKILNITDSLMVNGFPITCNLKKYNGR